MMHIRYVKCSFWCADLRFYRRKKGKSPPDRADNAKSRSTVRLLLTGYLSLADISRSLPPKQRGHEALWSQTAPRKQAPIIRTICSKEGVVLPTTPRVARQEKPFPVTIDRGRFITTVFLCLFLQGGHCHGHTRNLFRLYLTLVLLHYREY